MSEDPQREGSRQRSTSQSQFRKAESSADLGKHSSHKKLHTSITPSISRNSSGLVSSNSSTSLSSTKEPSPEITRLLDRSGSTGTVKTSKKGSLTSETRMSPKREKKHKDKESKDKELKEPKESKDREHKEHREPKEPKDREPKESKDREHREPKESKDHKYKETEQNEIKSSKDSINSKDINGESKDHVLLSPRKKKRSKNDPSLSPSMTAVKPADFPPELDLASLSLADSPVRHKKTKDRSLSKEPSKSSESSNFSKDASEKSRKSPVRSAIRKKASMNSVDFNASQSSFDSSLHYSDRSDDLEDDFANMNLNGDSRRSPIHSIMGYYKISEGGSPSPERRYTLASPESPPYKGLSNPLVPTATSSSSFAVSSPRRRKSPEKRLSTQLADSSSSYTTSTSRPNSENITSLSQFKSQKGKMPKKNQESRRSGNSNLSRTTSHAHVDSPGKRRSSHRNPELSKLSDLSGTKDSIDDYELSSSSRSATTTPRLQRSEDMSEELHSPSSRSTNRLTKRKTWNKLTLPSSMFAKEYLDKMSTETALASSRSASSSSDLVTEETYRLHNIIPFYGYNIDTIRDEPAQRTQGLESYEKWLLKNFTVAQSDDITHYIPYEPASCDQISLLTVKKEHSGASKELTGIKIVVTYPERDDPINISQAQLRLPGKSVLKGSSRKNVSVRKLLEYINPNLSKSRVRQTKANPDILSGLLTLARLKSSFCHADKKFKVGVVYYGGEKSAEAIMANEGTPAFREFVDLLGDKVALRDWNKFHGGLDITGRDMDGKESIFTEWNGCEIMCHVGPMLGSNLHQRRVHVGNDSLVIVFIDNPNVKFSPEVIQSTFNQIFIVVHLETDEALIAKAKTAQINLSTTKPDVPFNSLGLAALSSPSNIVTSKKTKKSPVPSLAKPANPQAPVVDQAFLLSLLEDQSSDSGAQGDDESPSKSALAPSGSPRSGKNSPRNPAHNNGGSPRSNIVMHPNEDQAYEKSYSSSKAYNLSSSPMSLPPPVSAISAADFSSPIPKRSKKARVSSIPPDHVLPSQSHSSPDFVSPRDANVTESRASSSSSSNRARGSSTKQREHTGLSNSSSSIESASYYKIAILRKDGIESFQPKMPWPPVFKKSAEFRDWLLTKITSGTIAAYSSPNFQDKLISNRKTYLMNILGTHEDN